MFVFVFDIPSQKQRKSIYFGAPELLRAQLNAPQSSSNSDLIGEVDVCPSGNPSEWICRVGERSGFVVKDPETSSASLSVVVAASDLLEVPRASSLQSEPALFDRATVEVVIDGDLAGGDMVPDVV